MLDSGQRRENTRVSFYDPPNQATLNRVLSGDAVLHEAVDEEGEGAREVKDESARATLESVEEMLEGYEWASDDILGRRALTGTVEQIEARLLDELMALDKARMMVSYLLLTLMVVRLLMHDRRTSIRSSRVTIG